MLRAGGVRDLLMNRLELIVLVVLAAGSFLLPEHLVSGWRHVPIGILLLSAAQAGTLALQAAGVVLVYRSNRIINFAQGALGAGAGWLFYNVVAHREVIYLLGKAGVPIGDSTYLAAFPLQVLNAVAGLVGGILVALIVSVLAYFLVIRWFERVPPLTVTVASIGLSFLISTLLGVASSQNFWASDFYGFHLPVEAVLNIGPVTADLPELLTIVVAPLLIGGLGLLLYFSNLGIALRAAASNADRAKTLGVPVLNLVSVSWIAAGLLSGVASLLSSPSSLGNAVQSSFGPEVLVRVLAVAVIARMRSLPMVLVGALGLAVIENSLTWNLGSSAIFTGALLVIITAFLLIRRERGGRADVAEETFAAAKEARPSPPVLRRFPTVRNYLVAGVGLLLVVLLGFPWVTPPDQVDAAMFAMTYAMVGLALLVLTGWAGQISLGHFAFAGVGAYVATLLSGSYGVPMLLAIIAGGAAGAVLATLIGLPALRLPGLNLAVVTLALALTVSSLLLNGTYLGRFLPTQLSRPGLLGLDGEDERVFYYFSLAVLAAVTVVVIGLRRSRLARALIAARDNPFAAQSFGVNLFFARLKAFAISGFIAALAGAVYAYQQHGIHPEAYAADVSMQQFLTAVVGGLGSVAGPPLGAALAYALPLTKIPVLAQSGVSLLSLVLLLFYPSGLAGIAFAIRDFMLRRVAIRHRIDVPGFLRGDEADRRHGRAPLAPKRRAPGTSELARYRITRQWGNVAAAEEVTHGG